MVPRVMVYDRTDAFVGELDPSHIYELPSVEEINGEHSVTITTDIALEKTYRVLLCDDMGKWHEYVVTGIDATRDMGGTVVNEYYCVWSLQYDTSLTFVNNEYGCGIVPGHASVMHPATDGMAIALSTTNRWTVGEVSVTSVAAASFYRRSGWESLQTVVEKWGGELQATITVGPSGVVSRQADLLAHVGASVATRRFDYGHDVASIKRTVSDEPWPCRIVPLGKSQETEAGGYTRRPTIESVNGGVMWIEDSEVVDLVKVRGPNWTWEYPTTVVENDTYEDPAELKAWALEHISDYTRPRVTYEASVVQLTRAGMSAHGVALGDEVVVVDRTFGADGLRISARVIRIEHNLLDPTDTTLTIGNAKETLSGQLSQLSKQIGEVAAEVSGTSSYQASSDYVSNLLRRLNTEANATGGFTYITEGQGIRCYDVEVSDPLVGDEASAVVEVKGGTIRIANSRTSAGDWDWLTVFTSGHVAAEAVTALSVTAGFIQGINGTYIDLDSGTVMLGDLNGFHLVANATELGFYQGDVRVAYIDNEMLHVPYALALNSIQVGEVGDKSWQWRLRDNGNFQLKWTGGEE